MSYLVAPSFFNFELLGLTCTVSITLGPRAIKPAGSFLYKILRGSNSYNKVYRKYKFHVGLSLIYNKYFFVKAITQDVQWNKREIKRKPCIMFLYFPLSFSLRFFFLYIYSSSLPSFLFLLPCLLSLYLHAQILFTIISYQSENPCEASIVNLLPPVLKYLDHWPAQNGNSSVRGSSPYQSIFFFKPHLPVFFISLFILVLLVSLCFAQHLKNNWVQGSSEAVGSRMTAVPLKFPQGAILLHQERKIESLPPPAPCTISVICTCQCLSTGSSHMVRAFIPILCGHPN